MMHRKVWNYGVDRSQHHPFYILNIFPCEQYNNFKEITLPLPSPFIPLCECNWGLNFLSSQATVKKYPFFQVKLNCTVSVCDFFSFLETFLCFHSGDCHGERHIHFGLSIRPSHSHGLRTPWGSFLKPPLELKPKLMVVEVKVTETSQNTFLGHKSRIHRLIVTTNF